MPRIVVVGAGVVGLTVAHELLESDPENRITVVGQQLPTDFEFKSNYTSPIAGANWESFAAPDDKFVQDIDAIGFKKFKEIIKAKPESGIIERKNRVLITKEKFNGDFHEKKTFPWFKNLESSNFRELLPWEFDNKKFVYGFEFDGFVINTGYYMNFLINEMYRKDDRFKLKRGTVANLEDAYNWHAEGRADLVINCTGLLAKQFVNDENMYPVRGVVYVAENNVGLDKIIVVETEETGFPDEALYIMPRREGELIIGGCFEVGRTEKTVTEEQRNRILSRPKKYLPQFNWDNLKVVREQVGFRPYRKGGYRIEKDNLIDGAFHCYGTGGAGFQSSWGCAGKIVKLVNDYKEGQKLFCKL